MVTVNLIYKTLFFVLLGTLFFVSTGYADQGKDEPQLLADTVLVTGMVKSIDFESKTVVIKPKKGKKMSFSYADQTEFRGVVSLNEIEKRQQVKIWYFKDGNKNMAVRIQLVPELGC